MNPPWWAEAETEANAIVKGFTAKLEKKLCESPKKIIRRKNPLAKCPMHRGHLLRQERD